MYWIFFAIEKAYIPTWADSSTITLPKKRLTRGSYVSNKNNKTQSTKHKLQSTKRFWVKQADYTLPYLTIIPNPTYPYLTLPNPIYPYQTLPNPHTLKIYIDHFVTLYFLSETLCKIYQSLCYFVFVYNHFVQYINHFVTLYLFIITLLLCIYL